MRSRGRLTFRSTLANTLYLVFKRLKHKSLLRCKASDSHVFFSHMVCDFVLLKLFLETARLMCVKKVWLFVRGPFCLKLHVVVSCENLLIFNLLKLVQSVVDLVCFLFCLVLDTGSFWFLLCLICSYFLSLVCIQGKDWVLM